MTILESLVCAINKQMKTVNAETNPVRLERAIARGEKLCKLHDRLAKKNGGRLSTWT